MFTSAPPHRFVLTLPEGEYGLEVLAFKGHEGISQPYRFELELVTRRRDIDFESLLHQQGFLAFNTHGAGIHGQLYSVAYGGPGRHLSHYRITLVPQLAYLQHRINQRIFQNLTVPQIIASVLKDHGLLGNAFSFNLSAPFPARDYCVQYQESDLDFIQRLCEEDGLHYHFQHSPDGHHLAFGDDQTFFRRLPDAVPYRPDSGTVAQTATIKTFDLSLTTRSTRATLRDYDFEKPHSSLEQATRASLPGAQPELEAYDYPGHFSTAAQGKQRNRRQLERQRADARQVSGKSDEPRLASGHFLTLTEHPQKERNDLWLLTHVTHEGRQPQVLEESVENPGSDNDDFTQGYRNTFLATPWEVFFRTPLQPRPKRKLNLQSAVVTGPPGKEIHCDPYGRVKVKFHWDRSDTTNDHSSGWLRVSSGWAGAGHGALSVPRVGMEVLVSFIDGNPDKPLIVGCLNNGTQPTPYPLPAHKTRSVFKSRSSPGGGGGNEIRIDDLKGQEEIYVQAQRDWEQHVGHDQIVNVGHERNERVEGNRYSEFKAEEHHIVHRDRRVEVKGNDHLTVGGSRHVQSGAGHFMQAGEEIHLSSGYKLVIDAGSELILKAGGNFIKIDGSGITFSQPFTIGGSAGKGSGVAALVPGQLEPVRKVVVSLEALMQQAATLRESRSGVCEVCDAVRNTSGKQP